MTRQAQKIEVGLHEGRPGFTVQYTDGERAHFVFHRQIAKDLAEALIKVVEELDYLDRQMAPPGFTERIGVREATRVQLQPPSLGIQSSEGMDTSD